MMRLKNISIAVLLILLSLVACDREKLRAESIWARASPMVVENGAIYLDLVNETARDETLLAITSSACEVMEIHTMRMIADDVMVMEPLTEGLILPAGSTTHLEPGGIHIMCLGKKVEFTEGEMLDVTLSFANADPLSVQAEVSTNDSVRKEHEMTEPNH